MKNVIFFGAKNIKVDKAYRRILLFFSLWYDTYHLYEMNEILFSLLWGSSWLSENISEGGNCESRSLIVSLFTFSCHCGQWHYSWESVGKSNEPWIIPGRREEPTPKSCALISTKGPWQVFAHMCIHTCTHIQNKK